MPPKGVWVMPFTWKVGKFRPSEIGSVQSGAVDKNHRIDTAIGRQLWRETGVFEGKFSSTQVD